jgi:hypothetical protein
MPGRNADQLVRQSADKRNEREMGQEPYPECQLSKPLEEKPSRSAK